MNAGDLISGSAMSASVVAESNAFLGSFAPVLTVIVAVGLVALFVGLVSRFWRGN